MVRKADNRKQNRAASMREDRQPDHLCRRKGAHGVSGFDSGLDEQCESDRPQNSATSR